MGTLSNKYYGNQLWRNARTHFLASHPLCIICERMGQLEPANVVDHITPHKGDMTLFWDQDNWQALCTRCHNQIKKRQESRSISSAMDADGWPINRV